MFGRSRSALLASLACAVALGIAGLLAHVWPSGRAGDAEALEGFVGLGSVTRDPFFDAIAALADPVPYGVLGLALVAVALGRGRWRLAALLPVVLFGAPLTTEVLKHVSAHPRVADWVIGPASWPSGHATASMVLALCAVLVAPPVLRPLAAVGGALFTLAVSFSILVLHWHFPSDVVGGHLCAAMWTLAAVAVLRRWEGAGTRRAGAASPIVAVAPALALAAGTAVAAAAVVLDRPRTWVGYVADHPDFALSAGIIVSIAGLLAATLVREMGRPTA